MQKWYKSKGINSKETKDILRVGVNWFGSYVYEIKPLKIGWGRLER